METDIKGDKNDYKMITTRTSHYVVMLEIPKESGLGQGFD